MILQSGGMKGVRAVALLEGKGESRDQVMSDKISTQVRWLYLVSIRYFDKRAVRVWVVGGISARI